MPSTLSVLFAGAGEFGVPTLRALAGGPHRVAGVISQPDKPAGRGKRLTPSAIAAVALELGLPLIRTVDINAEVLTPADVMVVIAFGQKIAPHVVNHPRLGSINLHASRLPKYRGAAPIHHAVLNGETVTGNSVIRLAEKMDAGAVLGMSEVPIGPTDTTGDLHDRLALDGIPLVERVLNELASGTAVEVEQDHARATLAGKLSRASTLLDFGSAAEQVARRTRAMYPWPGCRVRLVDAGKEIARLTLAVVEPRVDADLLRTTAGIIKADGSIACGTGSVLPRLIRPEGGRLMPFADYRNGRPWPVGAVVESIV